MSIRQDFKDTIYNNYKDNVHMLLDSINSKEFIKSKISGQDIVKQNLPQDLIQDLTWSVVTKDDYTLISRAYAEELSRGEKVKIRNILIKKIKPFLESCIANKPEDKPIDLNLPTVEDILDEVRKDKPQIRITGRPSKTENKVEEVEEVEEVQKVQEDATTMIQQLIESVSSSEFSKKDILTDGQKTLIRHFRNKLYSKDKIEIFPNQNLEHFISGDNIHSKCESDLVICDKATFEIICTVNIVKKASLDLQAVILNQVSIKRFIVKQVNGILDSQDIRDIEEEINNRYAPTCKMCGLPMKQKENAKNRRRFYACMDNQGCRFTIDMGD